MNVYTDKLTVSPGGYYGHRHVCDNCGDLSVLKIPTGETVSSYLKRKTCRVCGVKLAAPQQPKERSE